MAKKICFLLLIVIIGLISLLIINNNSDKIRLSKKYYNKGEFIKVNSSDIEKLKNDTYILYTYNNFCSFSIPCEDIFKEFMNKNKIDFISMPIDEFKNTSFYNIVKYAPSVIIIQKNKVIAYLDAESDDDLIKYQDASEFEKWIASYIEV